VPASVESSEQKFVHQNSGIHLGDSFTIIRTAIHQNANHHKIIGTPPFIRTPFFSILCKMGQRPGLKARGSILTRYIKPKQFVGIDDKNHRSNVVLEGRFRDDKGSEYYEFRYENEQDLEKPLMFGAARMIKILEEGHAAMIFTGPAPPRERKKDPSITWTKSQARKMLYEDICIGNVTIAMKPEHVFMMHPEYKEYGWEKFPERLKSLLAIVREAKKRADNDLVAYQAFVQHNPVSTKSHKGYDHWPGSFVQKLALQDISNKLHEEIGWRQLWMLRDDYIAAFDDFSAFRDKCKQEIRTMKYYHTLKVYGKSKPK
jgi:hypothetical protein